MIKIPRIFKPHNRKRMARPRKEGLEYVPIDVDIFDDPKIMFVCERFGEKGENIAIKLLLWIFKCGYHLKWDDDVCLLFANKKMKNASFDLVKDVVGELLKRGFFNEDMHKRFGILTSAGIQKRWLDIMTRSKRNVKINTDYDLFLPKKLEETTTKREETPLITEETTAKREESTQSKVKESKEEIYKESWPFPLPENVPDLPDSEAQSVWERQYQQGNRSIDKENIKEYFKVWLKQELRGKEHYATPIDVYKHFFRAHTGKRIVFVKPEAEQQNRSHIPLSTKVNLSKYD